MYFYVFFIFLYLNLLGSCAAFFTDNGQWDDLDCNSVEVDFVCNRYNPTADPTANPTNKPSNQPTDRPTNTPTRRPTNQPTVSQKLYN